MKRRFSDEKIIGMIKEYEAGVKAQDLCRKYGISDAALDKFKAMDPEFQEWPITFDASGYVALYRFDKTWR